MKVALGSVASDQSWSAIQLRCLRKDEFMIFHISYKGTFPDTINKGKILLEFKVQYESPI